MTVLMEGPAVAHEWPCAEIHKTETSYEVEIETPGFGPDDLDVEIEGHTLMVFGTPEHAREGAAFQFIFEIPADASLERFRAEYADGVLIVAAPRRHRLERRKVEIETRSLVNPDASGV